MSSSSSKSGSESSGSAVSMHYTNVQNERKHYAFNSPDPPSPEESSDASGISDTDYDYLPSFHSSEDSLMKTHYCERYMKNLHRPLEVELKEYWDMNCVDSIGSDRNKRSSFLSNVTGHDPHFDRSAITVYDDSQDYPQEDFEEDSMANSEYREEYNKNVQRDLTEELHSYQQGLYDMREDRPQQSTFRPDVYEDDANFSTSAISDVGDRWDMYKDVTGTVYDGEDSLHLSNIDTDDRLDFIMRFLGMSPPPPADGSCACSSPQSGSFATPAITDGTYDVPPASNRTFDGPRRGSGTFDVPRRGSGTFDVPRRGSGTFDVPPKDDRTSDSPQKFRVNLEAPSKGYCTYDGPPTTKPTFEGPTNRRIFASGSGSGGTDSESMDEGTRMLYERLANHYTEKYLKSSPGTETLEYRQRNMWDMEPPMQQRSSYKKNITTEEPDFPLSDVEGDGDPYANVLPNYEPTMNEVATLCGSFDGSSSGFPADLNLLTPRDEKQGPCGCAPKGQGTFNVPPKAQGTFNVPPKAQGTFNVPPKGQGTYAVPKKARAKNQTYEVSGKAAYEIVDDDDRSDSMDDSMQQLYDKLANHYTEKYLKSSPTQETNEYYKRRGWAGRGQMQSNSTGVAGAYNEDPNFSLSRIEGDGDPYANVFPNYEPTIKDMVEPASYSYADSGLPSGLLGSRPAAGGGYSGSVSQDGRSNERSKRSGSCGCSSESKSSSYQSADSPPKKPYINPYALPATGGTYNYQPPVASQSTCNSSSLSQDGRSNDSSKKSGSCCCSSKGKSSGRTGESSLKSNAARTKSFAQSPTEREDGGFNYSAAAEPGSFFKQTGHVAEACADITLKLSKTTVGTKEYADLIEELADCRQRNEAIDIAPAPRRQIPRYTGTSRDPSPTGTYTQRPAAAGTKIPCPCSAPAPQPPRAPKAPSASRIPRPRSAVPSAPRITAPAPCRTRAKSAVPKITPANRAVYPAATSRYQQNQYRPPVTARSSTRVVKDMNSSEKRWRGSNAPTAPAAPCVRFVPIPRKLPSGGTPHQRSSSEPPKTESTLRAPRARSVAPTCPAASRAPPPVPRKPEEKQMAKTNKNSPECRQAEGRPPTPQSGKSPATAQEAVDFIKSAMAQIPHDSVQYAKLMVMLMDCQGWDATARPTGPEVPDPCEYIKAEMRNTDRNSTKYVQLEQMLLECQEGDNFAGGAAAGANSTFKRAREDYFRLNPTVDGKRPTGPRKFSEQYPRPDIDYDYRKGPDYSEYFENSNPPSASFVEGRAAEDRAQIEQRIGKARGEWPPPARASTPPRVPAERMTYYALSPKPWERPGRGPGTKDPDESFHTSLQDPSCSCPIKDEPWTRNRSLP